ncbi:Signal recognition particle, SRP19 subunit like protein [Aduncisulcus paluster]|uniref:Signal recognition particle, SRP19 subunit like protein n=1 Tax=Aduncisulcus paluster TaxID=2918883 RepID=A0ABQ5K0S0_9EUKA|nr:Signal recognition particle, SRP19 subunit like protein [Aduncisulcus paluster]
MHKGATIQKGRVIGLEYCVEEPTAEEIYLSVKELGLECELEEDKQHPCWHCIYPSGRVKITLYGEDGKPLNEEFKNKRALLKALKPFVEKHKAELIMKRKPAKKEKKKKGEKKELTEADVYGVGQSRHRGGKGKGKRGKKKK